MHSVGTINLETPLCNLLNQQKNIFEYRNYYQMFNQSLIEFKDVNLISHAAVYCIRIEFIDQLFGPISGDNHILTMKNFIQYVTFLY